MIAALSSPASLARTLAYTLLAVRLAFFDLLEILRARSINDYSSFHAAASAIRHGLDPYAAADLQYAANLAMLPRAKPYLYPPLLAELLVPMTWLKPFAARLIWMGATVTAFLASAALLDRWIARRWPEDPARCDHARTAFAVAVCSLWPLRSTQMMAQVNALVLLLLVAWYTRRDAWRWAGVFLGVAAAIKMSPALLVLVPLTERRWREATVATVSGAVLVLGSCAVIGERGGHFLQSVLMGFVPGHAYHGLTVPIPLTGNHSLGAMAYWLIDHGTGGDVHRLSPRAAALHLGAVLVLLSAWALRSLRGATPEGRVASLAVLMVLAPTFAYEHHVSFAVLPIALTVCMIVGCALSRGWAVVAVVAMALLTEHESSFLWPAYADGRVALLVGNAGKLAPLLALFVVGLVASRRRELVARSHPS